MRAVQSLSTVTVEPYLAVGSRLKRHTSQPGLHCAFGDAEVQRDIVQGSVFQAKALTPRSRENRYIVYGDDLGLDIEQS